MNKHLLSTVFVALTLAAIGAGEPERAAGTRGYDIRDFGAVGDGTTNCTKMIQKAIDACGEAGGGTVNVPPGKFVTGTLWMKSHVTLHLDSGSTLLGSQDVNDFPEWKNKWEGPKAPGRRAALISGEGLDDVAITGRGTIDARGAMWWEMQRAGPKGVEVLRPLTYRLVDSKNLLVEGITIRNSPMWTISPLNCENVTVSKVTIINPPDAPNTDGINPESCRNVHIENCHIDVGDDCITIKSGKETDGRAELTSCQNITITNCTLVRGHGGVVLGSEMSGSVRNVTISNCVFVGTDRGLRFKSRRGRGGVIEDVRASNLVMDGVLCPIAINLFYGPGAWGDKKVTDSSPAPVDDGTPKFRRLKFSNITAVNVKIAAVYILGLPEMPVEDVSIDQCSFLIDPKHTQTGTPDMAPVAVKVARAGILARWVKGLSIRNVDISEQVGPAVSITECSNVVLHDVAMKTATTDGATMLLENTSAASVRGCSVPKGAATALKIIGDKSDDVRVRDNNFADAGSAVEVGPEVKKEGVKVAAAGQ